MKKEDLKAKLTELEREIHKICRFNGIIFDSALYAYLNMAETALGYAKLTYNEYNEEWGKKDE